MMPLLIYFTLIYLKIFKVLNSFLLETDFFIRFQVLNFNYLFIDLDRDLNFNHYFNSNLNLHRIIVNFNFLIFSYIIFFCHVTKYSINYLFLNLHYIFSFPYCWKRKYYCMKKKIFADVVIMMFIIATSD